MAREATGQGLAAAKAQVLSVGMGNFEPYFIAKGESGIFTDILKAVFLHMPDYQPHFVFGHSNNGLWASFTAGRLDAVANLFDSVTTDACRSDPVFRFRDIAMTLADNNLSIDSIAALEGKSVVTFEGARNFFGPEFARVVMPDRYQEVRKPELQTRMLYGRRYQVSVGDMFIFLDSVEKLSGIGARVEAVAFHDIFPVLVTRMGFHDPVACSQFNEALRKIKASGEYEAIYQRYLERLKGVSISPAGG